MPENHNPASEKNHELLISLGSEVKSIGESLKAFVVSTQEENVRIHARISATEDKMARAIDGLKDSIGTVKESESARGKLSTAHIAVLLSSFALIGGVVHFYVSSQIATVTPTIRRSESDVATLTQRMDAASLEAVRRDSTLALQTAKESADCRVSQARIEKDVEWLLKISPTK